VNGFESRIGVRKKSHSAYLTSIPDDRKTELTIEAEAELKRGIDADWRASILRYPEVLDYFYSLVKVSIPDDRDPAVARAPVAPAGHMGLFDSHGDSYSPRHQFSGALLPDDDSPVDDYPVHRP
jgi:hypothetical protein